MIIFCYFYESLKHRFDELKLVIFSMMYHCIVLYFYNQFFYSNIITIGFLIKIVIAYLIYIFVWKRKIRLKF